MLNVSSFRPAAPSRADTPSDSRTSSVCAWITAAREVFLPLASFSMTTGATPACLSVAARARPVGPAPTMRTSVSMGFLSFPKKPLRREILQPALRVVDVGEYHRHVEQRQDGRGDEASDHCDRH